jgi:hypothetical protein
MNNIFRQLICNSKAVGLAALGVLAVSLNVSADTQNDLDVTDTNLSVGADDTLVIIPTGATGADVQLSGIYTGGLERR